GGFLGAMGDANSARIGDSATSQGAEESVPNAGFTASEAIFCALSQGGQLVPVKNDSFIWYFSYDSIVY
ncbi:MAG: hypothetical protein RSF90_00295, partial [Pygmaiobacter sp.]